MSKKLSDGKKIECYKIEQTEAVSLLKQTTTGIQERTENITKLELVIQTGETTVARVNKPKIFVLTVLVSL